MRGSVRYDVNSGAGNVTSVQLQALERTTRGSDSSLQFCHDKESELLSNAFGKVISWLATLNYFLLISPLFGWRLAAGIYHYQVISFLLAAYAQRERGNEILFTLELWKSCTRNR